MKNEFINYEVWLLTRMGAFQRARIYKPKVSEKQKREFSLALKTHLDNLIKNQYSKKVSEEKHIKNIDGIIDFSKGCQKILKKGLNFGVSQKLLNLYLKYHWCLGEIPTPPHFPVDRIIQKKLKLPVVSWTKMTGEKGREDYLRIIKSAKRRLEECANNSPENNCNNIAELELMLFNEDSKAMT